MNKLQQECLELCWEIEKLPASELQTKISLMASELSQKLYNLSNSLKYEHLERNDLLNSVDIKDDIGYL